MEEIDLQYEGPYEEDDPVKITTIPEFDSLLKRLEENDPIRAHIIDTFRRGLGPISDHVDVFTVYQNRLHNPIQDKQVFNLIGLNLFSHTLGSQKEEFGFYGATKEEVLDIINIGFCGGGSIVLSNSHFSSHSAFKCVPDRTGIYHVLFCKVHVGRTHVYDGQLIEGTMSQRPPTNFDIGATHREFLVYDCHKNSYVLPMFIVSFSGAKFKAVHKDIHELICQPSSRTPLNILCAFANMLMKFETTSNTSLNVPWNAIEKYEIDANADVLIHRIRELPNFDGIRRIFGAYFFPLLSNCICIASASEELRDAMATLMQ